MKSPGSASLVSRSPLTPQPHGEVPTGSATPALSEGASSPENRRLAVLSVTSVESKSGSDCLLRAVFSSALIFAES